jgi:3-oxoacyl-[acyl-carrier-protein] synthase I
MSTRLCVVGVGAVTPVGLSTLQTCSAIRAGVSAYGESELQLATSDFEPMIAATVPLRPRPGRSKPSGRFSALAKIALAECMRDAALEPSRTALFLGVPEKARVDEFQDWFGDDLYGSLEKRIVRPFHASSALVPHGNASTFAGLARAREVLEQGIVDACVVGGVDSLVNDVDLNRLEGSWRLHREGESTGLVPGEGAAFIAVRSWKRTRENPVLGVIAGLGLDEEGRETTVVSDGHPTGEGLRRAFEKAVLDANMTESAIGLRVSDLNGERYGSMDALLAMSRFYRTFRDGLPIWHPAECVGETGAAAGALLIQVACHAFSRGYSPSNTVMCEASSDSGRRSACVIQSMELAS